MVTICKKDIKIFSNCDICGSSTGLQWFGTPVLCLSCEDKSIKTRTAPNALRIELIKFAARPFDMFGNPKKRRFKKSGSIVTPLEGSKDRPKINISGACK